MTLGHEAAAQIAAATILWLLAAASVPPLLILHFDLLSGRVPLPHALIAFAYDVLLLGALTFLIRSDRRRSSSVVLALVLLPLAILSGSVVVEGLMRQNSTVIIH